MGLYRTGSAYCTQCEAEGFRRIAYFLDRPDVLSTYRVRLEADRAEAPVLLANGNLESAGDAEAPGRHYAIWRDPHKKPCYLFALVAGDLGHIADSFVTASGRRVALAIYVEHGREERAHYAMDALKRSMAWDERAYGREYDLDVFNIVAVSDFNMGAMENKGLNVFNDKYVLASPETATDDDYAGIEGVIAHEYFHNWTGNRVTCRDWFQLCLKEGLTVFRDQEFSADMRSAPVKRIADVRTLRAAQFPEDAGPLAHNVRPEIYHEISNFYTATVYQKGAEVIRMLKRLIGAQAFRAGMDLYFERYDGQAATVEDFIGCFATVSGRDLTLFMRWYSQAGTPKITVHSAYDAAAKTYRLDIAQALAPTPGQAVKLPATMPLALGLVGPNGGDVPLASSDATADELASGVFELKDAERSIVFRDVPQRPTLSFLRGFTAPVRVDDDLTEEDLIVLSRHDSDNFNRWQSLQSLATRILLRAVKAIRAGRAPERDGESRRRLRRADRGSPCRPHRLRLRGAGDEPADGSGHRARDRRGRRSGCDLCRAQGHARRARARARRRARRPARRTRRFFAFHSRRGRGRPPRAAQRRAQPVRRRRRDRGTGARPPPDRGRRQHDRTPRRARGDCASSRTPRANMRLSAFGRRYAMEPAHSRQMVRAAGADSRARDARARARADEPPRILARQSQPRARADRRVHGQSDAVQPRSTGLASRCSKRWSSFSIRPIRRSPRGF